MKKLIWPVLACSITISCGKKNESNKNANLLIPLKVSKQIDSDNDGLTDKEERSLGSNPYLADFPRLKIKMTTDTALKNKYITNTNDYDNEIDFTRNPKSKILEVRKHAAKLAFAQMKNLKEDFPYINLKGYLKEQVRCMSRFEYMRKFDQIVNNYNSLHFDHHNIEFYYTLKYESSLKKISIEKPNFSLFFNRKYLGDFETLKKYYDLTKYRGRLIQREKQEFVINRPVELEVFSDDENCFHIGANNFDYNINNKTYSYKKTIEKLSDKNSTVIILKKGMLKEYSVNPENMTISSLLERTQAQPIFNSDGELLKAYGVVNEFKDFNEFDINQHKNLAKRRWFFLSSNNSKFYEPLEEGQVYILAHLSLEEILADAHYKKLYQGKLDQQNRLRLTDLYVGDDITLEVNATGTMLAKAHKNYYLTGFHQGRGIGRPKKNKCYIVETNRYDQTPLKSTYNNFKNNKIFNLKMNARTIRPKVLKNKLVYELTVQEKDLKKGFIEIKFPKVSTESYEYIRHIDVRRKKKVSLCYDLPYGGKVRMRTYTRRFKAKKRLDYDINIVHRGIKR